MSGAELRVEENQDARDSSIGFAASNVKLSTSPGMPLY
jgi:hypothetical protein